MKTRILVLLTMAAATLAQSRSLAMEGINFGRPIPVCVTSLTDRFGSPIVGDVTGDGHLDIVVPAAHTDLQGYEIRIFPGRGDGTFAAPILASTTVCRGGLSVRSTYVPCLVDLNKDGIMDVVSGGDLYPFTVIWGNRSGRFRTEALGSRTRRLSWYTTVLKAADLNHDGWPDLTGWGVAVPYQRPATYFLVTLLSSGAGGFAEYVREIGCTGEPIAMADFNHDGRFDLLTCDSSAPWPNWALKVLLAQNTGAFVALPDFAECTDRWAVLVKDINGDGQPDITVPTMSRDEDYTVVAQTFLNNGDGTFNGYVGFKQQTEWPFELVANAIGQVEMADFDGDGIVDAAATVNSSEVGLFQGSGNGCFTKMGDLLLGDSYLRSDLNNRLFVLPSLDPYMVKAADFNEDGRLDLLVCGDHMIRCDFGIGYYSASALVVLLNQWPSRPQILWQSADGHLATWSVAGNSVVTAAAVRLLPRGNWQAVGLNDFDEDGSTDLLMGNGAGQLQIWYFKNHTFARAENLNRTAPSGTAELMGFADVDADGRNELIWKVGSSFVVWKLRGSKVASQQFMEGNPALGSAHVVGFGDFDGDGYADVVAQDKSGRMLVSLQQGIRLKGMVRLADGRKATPGWHAVSIADFNADDKPDILWQHDDGRVAIWLMDGTKVLASKLLRNGKPASPGWRIIGVN